MFEVVQQCVCWGWVGSRLSQLGCCRSATRRVGLTAQAFVLNKGCSHRYAVLLWSTGQLNHSQVTPELDYEALSCTQEDMFQSWRTKHLHLQRPCLFEFPCVTIPRFQHFYFSWTTSQSLGLTIQAKHSFIVQQMLFPALEKLKLIRSACFVVIFNNLNCMTKQNCV